MPATTGRLRRKYIVIGAAAAVVVAAGILGPLSWRWYHDGNEEVGTPKQVAGLVLDNSQGARDTIDYLRTAMETGVSLDNSTGGVYEDRTAQSKSVLFIGGTGVLVSPSQALTKTFALISDDNGGVVGVHDVAAGPLGGVMRCGSTQTDGGAMAVCAWADHGSIGLGMFPNRPVDQSAELLRTMRGSIQKPK